MKLCPHCAFIYEDGQRFCDMDGKELVHDLEPVVEQSVASPARLTTSPTARPKSGRAPVLILGGVILATLLSGFYVARLHQSRSNDAGQSSLQPLERSTAPVSATAPPPDLVSSKSVVHTPLPEQSPEQTPDQSPGESSALSTNLAALNSASVPEASQSSSTGASITRARLTSSPVSAGGLAGKSRGPVIVRLSNGAAIRADEAWEKREGIWYRQAGMVTFLKRSRVRRIEPAASSQPQTRAAVNNADASSRSSGNLTAENQLRIRQLEAANPKKQSRVKSFLRRTGQILKKPFRF